MKRRPHRFPSSSIQFDSGDLALYHLSVDPYEVNNLMDAPLDDQAQTHFDALSQALQALLATQD